MGGADATPPGEVEALRRIARERIRGLRRANAPRAGDPGWSRDAKDRQDRGAGRGFDFARGLLEQTAPGPGNLRPTTSAGSPP